MEAVHDALGVQWFDGPGGRVPRNYGDPGAEYDAARSGVVIADRTDRAFIRVYGRDPVKMIQGLISNDVEKASPERSVYATVLTPKGKMVADARVLRRGDDLLLELDAGALDGLVAHLRKYVPPLYARFEDARDRLREIGVYGPAAAVLVRAVLGIDVGTMAEDDVRTGTFDDDEVIVVATAMYDVPGYDLFVPANRAEEIWAALMAGGARPVGHATLEVLRIEAGRPRWGAELTYDRFPLEAGLRERAISESKGCYTGQEVIIRILHRGHVNWNLKQLMLGDAAVPASGTEIVDDAGKVVQRITSAAWSPKYGQTVALAYVRRGSDAEPDV